MKKVVPSWCSVKKAKSIVPEQSGVVKEEGVPSSQHADRKTA
jgi:hypothetical protein